MLTGSDRRLVTAGAVALFARALRQSCYAGRVLGRMYDGIEYRGFHQTVVEDTGRYSRDSRVPVWIDGPQALECGLRQFRT